MDLAKIIDHTILKPDCSREDVERICEEAKTHRFSTVCVPPFYVKDAATILEDSLVKVTTVIGFPMGYSSVASKVEEIKRAINDGVDEVEVVVNLCAVKSGNWNYVRNDIDSVTRAVHLKGKVIKIILETELLTATEMKKICDLCTEIEVNYIKNSTGLLGKKVKPETIAYLKSMLPKSIKIKAFGEIQTPEHAQELVAAGANRLGSSSSVQVLNGN